MHRIDRRRYGSYAPCSVSLRHRLLLKKSGLATGLPAARCTFLSARRDAPFNQPIMALCLGRLGRPNFVT